MRSTYWTSILPEFSESAGGTVFQVSLLGFQGSGYRKELRKMQPMFCSKMNISITFSVAH